MPCYRILYIGRKEEIFVSVGIPMHYEAYLKQKGTPVVESADKTHPKGLFSSAIFGVTEEERSNNYALINLYCYCMRPHIVAMLKQVDRKFVSCLTTRTEHKINKQGRLVPYDPTEPVEEGEVVGYGPSFLFDNWEKLDRKYLQQTVGRYNNKEMKSTLVKMGRDDFFTHYTYVLPLAYREEEGDSMILVNDDNIMLGDIIRYANLLKNKVNISERDIEILLQSKLLEYCEYLIKRYLGPHGVARKGVLSRSVANSSRSVALPATYNHPVLGNSKIGLLGLGLPIQHLLHNFRDTVIKFSKDLIQYLYDNNCFDPDVTQDYLSVYDVEYLQDRIEKMEDPYQRVCPFPAVKADGSFRPCVVPISVMKNGAWVEEEEHPLSWIEFFFIVCESFANLYETKFVTNTRYPIDSTLSLQMLRPVTLTLSDRLLKEVKIFGFHYIGNYPYIGDGLEHRYQDKIFESSSRFAPHVIAAQNGDYDGDQTGCKPINTEEAVEEANNVNTNLLNIFDWAGNYRRGVGKDCDQTWYTFTRDPKPKDKAKEMDPKHPFLQYLEEMKDGKLDTRVLYSYTCVFEEGKKPECGLYDTVKIKVNGKRIETTLGRYIFNKVIFWEIWDTPYMEFLNEPVYSDVLGQQFSYVGQLIIEKKVDPRCIHRMIDLSSEFGMRLANVYNAGLTYTMLNPDETFTNFRDKKLDAVKEKVLDHGDLESMIAAEKEILDYAKKYYKDDDMAEIYESDNKAKWDNDFKTLNVSMGALPKLTGGKPSVVFECLADGISPEYIPDLTNVGMVGSTNRAKQTALAGAGNKDLGNGLQSVVAIKGDCGSTKGIQMHPTKRSEILNRYVLVHKKPVKVTLENVDDFLHKDIEVRDVIHCHEKNGNYCSTCTGDYIFEATNSKKVHIGMMVTDVASAILNMFMKSTHNLKADVFRIKDLHDFIHPSTNALFEIKTDPVDKIEKVYCLQDITWNVPLAAVDAVDTEYSVLAHGSIVTLQSGEQFTFVLGTEVHTTPGEIINPDMEETPELERHVIFTYKKGEPFLNQTITYRKEMTVYKMMNLFLSGNVSNLVPFETHLETMQNAIKTNKKVKINDISLRVILTSLARDKQDPKKPARETDTGQYQFVSLYDLVVLGGMFNAMFGPNALKGIFVNLNKSEAEQNKTPSPIEKALRY